METFHKLFGSLLGFVYHCFDRIVIQGYLPLLTRPAHIVHFFRDVHGVSPLTKDVLAKRTQEYQQWVEAFARNHRIPIEWPDAEALKTKKLKKEDYVRPYGQRMARQKRFGVYFIFKSLEQGPMFGIRVPKYPTDDPAYRIVTRQRSPYTHYYFYIRDEVLGPFVLCVGSFLPFQSTYYLNGHHIIAGDLQRRGVRVRTDDNAFLWTTNLEALQAAADRLDPEVIRQRLEYWTLVLGPKFSKKDRTAINLRRAYSLNQVEYCRNFVFRRHFPIHKIFERSCELGVFRLTADVITQIFGVRKHKRLRGKLHTMLEKLDHGHHVLRIYCKSLVARTYEKFGTFLRVEVCVNRLKDLGLNKGLEQLPALRENAVLQAFALTPDAYSLTQLRYDVRKLRAHGLLQREGRSYSYRLTDKGIKVAAMFVLFQKRVCGPLANTLFHHRPTKTATLPAKIEAAYHKADVAIQNVIDLLAA